MIIFYEADNLPESFWKYENNLMTVNKNYDDDHDDFE